MRPFIAWGRGQRLGVRCGPMLDLPVRYLCLVDSVEVGPMDD